MTQRSRVRDRARARTWAAIVCLPLSAAAASAAAQGSSVQIYGHLSPMVDDIRVSGTTPVAPVDRPFMLSPKAYGYRGDMSLLRMQSSTTNFGFRGTEDLGGGLQALFQLESGFQLNDGNWTGGAGRAFNRNSRVGLSSDLYGTLFAGIWDTPSGWSQLGLTNGVRNPYAGDSSTIFLTPGFNIPHSVTADTRTNSPADAVFNRRQGNSLQYWSPKWAGFSFRLSYSMPEGGRTAANGTHYKPSIMGLGGEYASGPWLVRYVYQQQKDYFGLAWIGPNPAANPDAPGATARSSKDVNHRLIARYNFNPNWALQGTFDRVDYRAEGVALGAMNRYSRNAWEALVIYRHEQHTVWANAGQASDGQCARVGAQPCSTNDLGAYNWGLGYRNALSRRTGLFVSIYGVNNRASGQYGVFPRIVAGIPPGSRQNGITLGFEHAF